MKFTAEIDVMPLKQLLDPQGKAVISSMHKIGFNKLEDVRIGKHITLAIEANDENAAKQMVEDACTKVLANPVMEYFEYEIVAN